MNTLKIQYKKAIMNYYNVFYFIDKDKYYYKIGPIYGYYLITPFTYIYVLINESNMDQVETFINDLSTQNFPQQYIINNFISDQNWESILSIYFDDFYFDKGKLNEPIKESHISLESALIYNKEEVYHINELNPVYKNFANIILTYNHNREFEIDNKNELYKKVLEYFANGKYDEGLQNISLVLNSTQNTEVYTTSNCNSCDSINNNLSCYDYYIAGMNSHLINMLSDVNFYSNWFILEDNVPYVPMIDALINLLNSELEILSKNMTTIQNHCNCHINKNVSIYNDNYKSYIMNYIELLNIIKECLINENLNKIKVYGASFAEVLPNI